jgi:hypothetical protein
VIHIAKTCRTTAKKKVVVQQIIALLYTRLYGGFEQIKAAISYALNKGM